MDRIMQTVNFYTTQFAGRALCLLYLAAGGSAAQAQAQVYTLDPQHTQVLWEVRHFGTSTSRGRITDIDGSITLDRKAGLAEVSMRIGTASINTGVKPLDTILRGEYYFASAEHPSAYFVASRVRLDEGAVREVRGEFSLRNTSLPLTLRALSFTCRPHPTLPRELCGGDFEAELRRSDYGITHGLPFVADQVRLLIQVEALGP